MHRRLLLWDVDGTLVRAGDLGAAVFDAAFEHVVGRRPARRIQMSGKTDPQIVREYLSLMDVEEMEGTVDTVGAVLGVMECHLAAAAADLAASGSACPGAEEVLRRLAGDARVLSSVLTGNTASNAVVKLAAFGLDRWLDLEVGAYGSDESDRNLLVPVALKRVADLRGERLSPEDVWVIGDTPRDLACAQAGGARCLLLATGRYRVEELVSLGADVVVDDLADADAVVKVLTGDL